MKLLSAFAAKRLRIVVAACVKQKRGDAVDRPAVEIERSGQRALANVDDGHDDRRLARPLDALARGEDRAAV